MNQSILTKIEVSINDQIISQEHLLGYHERAGNLLKALLDTDLRHYSHERIRLCLWVLSSILRNARDLNEVLLSTSFKTASHLEMPWRSIK